MKSKHALFCDYFLKHLYVFLSVGFILLLPLQIDADDEIPQLVLESASELIPGLMPEKIEATPIKELYLVSFGSQIIYISTDGRYVVAGDMIDTKSGRNLAEEVRSLTRRKLIDDLSESGMVVFTPEAVRSTITVFTDITCPYCVKLHNEIEELLKGGVKVRYLGYPRAGLSSSANDILVSVWCSTDRGQAMTNAKAGKRIEELICETPIAAHMLTAEKMGVRGTPTIVLQNGELIPGYVPSSELIARSNGVADSGG
ncbi:MAG: disulfide bond formation protein DsbC [Acidiferrobacteraceae bacterium]|nr:disulfide bond formation protein DsbC [Acidiferrobacteraceae bacterium]